LAALLNACVHAGASIGFVLPHSLDDSLAFWTQKVRPGLIADHRAVLVATVEDGGGANGAGGAGGGGKAGVRSSGGRPGGRRIAGSVQLNCDTPGNQPHRAEVTKLLVHPDLRRRGIARALMVSLELVARGRGRSLITLDTRSGDAAEPLYRSLGYQPVGIIPGYARDIRGDRYDSTTIMFKTLSG
jgi:ribosomal protein S18 acetylase RimI-like enzyme